MQNSSSFSVDSLMGKKSLDAKMPELESDSERKSAFSVAPPLPKREPFAPPGVCNCQPCQQTSTAFPAISQSVVPAEPRFMSLQSMAGTVTLPAPVYLPKSKQAYFLMKTITELTYHNSFRIRSVEFARHLTSRKYLSRL